MGVDIPQVCWKEKRFIVSIFVVAVIVRLAFFWAYTRHDDCCMLAFDSEQYDQVALNIAHGHGIVTEPGVPNFYRLPGYPVYVAACYACSGDSKRAALILQLLIASVIPLLIFILAMAMFPGCVTVAKVAAVASVIHPGFVMYAGIFSTESLFLILFLLFLIFLLSRHPLSAGLVLGVSSLVRAVGHYLIPFSLIHIFFLARSWRRGMIDGGLFIFGWLVVVAPWLVRNYLLAGAIFLHTLPGLHFLQYPAVNVVMDTEHADYFQAKKKVFALWDAAVVKQEQALARPLSEYEHYEVAGQCARSILFAHPLLALKHALIQCVRTCGTLYSTLLLYVPKGTVYAPDAGLWFKIKLYLFPQCQSDWLRWFIYWELLLSFLVAIGMVLVALRALYDKQVRLVLLYSLPYMLVLVAMTLAYGCARLRLPLEPFLLVLAAYGWFGTVKK